MDKARLKKELNTAENKVRDQTKELRAFYSLTEIIERENISLDELYQEVANILPNSWQYPDIACSRLVIDGSEYRTSNFSESPWRQSAPVKVHGATVGRIDVGYLAIRPEEDEGPFLREERLLIDAIAERVGRITERKHSEQELIREKEFTDIALNAQLDTFFVFEPSTGKAVRWNKAFSHVSGYSDEEIRRLKAPDSYYSLEDQNKAAKFTEHLFREGNGRIELVLICKDGRRIPTEYEVSVLHDHQSKTTYFVSVGRDITERKRMEETLKLDEERLEVLLNLTQMAIRSEKEITDFALEAAVKLTKSKGGYLHFFNEDEKTIQLHSWSKAVLKTCTSETVHHYPLEAAGIWADSVRLRKAVVHNDYQGINSKKGYPEGHFHLVRHLGVPIFDGKRIVGVAGVGNKEELYNGTDVRQLTLLMDSMWRILKQKRMAAKLELLAITDDLTGLANRRHFNAVLEEEIRRARRKNFYLSLMMIDVDHFKRYNDLYGHVAGDRCLQVIADVMRQTCKRAGQLPARYGGEEFAIIMPGSPTAEATVVAEMMRVAVMDKGIPHKGSEVAQVVTVSIGIATSIVSSSTSFQWFIKEADEALYQAKAQGRNLVIAVVN